MLNLYGKGLDESLIITDTAKKWSVKRKTIYQDWYRRHKWVKEVAGFKELDKAFWELMFDLKKLSTEAYVLYLKTEHPSARVGALRLAVDIKVRMASMIWDVKQDNLLKELDMRVTALEEVQKREEVTTRNDK